MGVPNLTIEFHKAAQEVESRLKRGVVAIIVRDATVTPGLYRLGSETDIPSGLAVATEDYVKRAFTGWINRPQTVLLSVIDADDDLVAAGAAPLAACDFDYLAGPPSYTGTEADDLVDWLDEAREGYCIGKLVLPNEAADNMAVVNFVASGIKVGETSYTAGDYCSRIAGILAGTTISGSGTYAQLPEVTAVTAQADPDSDIDGGKLILLHDGRKAKIARAVNSLQTLGDLPASLKKIKVVEAVDLIRSRARSVIEDSYIGRMANSYDNKQLLVAELQSFLQDLESEGVLTSGTGYAELDLDAQRAWLVEQGTDVSAMTDQEILQADTGSWVFIRMGGTILDAMEDFAVGFWMGGNAA